MKMCLIRTLLNLCKLRASWDIKVLYLIINVKKLRAMTEIFEKQNMITIRGYLITCSLWARVSFLKAVIFTQQYQ